ncbi:hypothetical protein SAMN02745724_03225, partial [Pseudoalteromonas denitrificans DSM 6059]
MKVLTLQDCVYLHILSDLFEWLLASMAKKNKFLSWLGLGNKKNAEEKQKSAQETAQAERLEQEKIANQEAENARIEAERL